MYNYSEPKGRTKDKIQLPKTNKQQQQQLRFYRFCMNEFVSALKKKREKKLKHV